MRLIPTISVAMFSMLVAGQALADPPHCPPGHAKKGWCDTHRNSDRAYEQGYRDGRDDAHWEIGRRLDRDVRYVVIHERDYDRYDLRRPPRGAYYAEVDGRILLIQAATQVVLQALASR